MTHSDFMELRLEGKIRMGIDQSKALWLIELLPLRYQYAHYFWSWVWGLSIPGAFVVWYFFAWYWGLASLLIVTPAIFRATKTSAAQFVMEHAENDPLFFDHLMSKGLLTFSF